MPLETLGLDPPQYRLGHVWIGSILDKHLAYFTALQQAARLCGT
jgi:hypothetical protein